MTKPITGRCFCGAVRFQFNEAPVAVMVATPPAAPSLPDVSK